MENKLGLLTGSRLLGLFTVLLAGVSLFASHAEGQQGNNAVYYYSTSNPGMCCTPYPSLTLACLSPTPPISVEY